MLVQEAEWIANEINIRWNELSPLINVGSSTEHFRTVHQPFIDSLIMTPFKQKGGTLLHLDMKADVGVDLVGDLMDESFRNQLKSLKLKGVLCSNLLEHVVDPKTVCDLLVDIVQLDGFVLITVPYRYPYHNDPIDTMLRPSVNDLNNLFPNCEVVKGEILTIKGTSFFKMLIKNPKLLFVTTMRVFLPFYKFQSWKHIVSYIPNSFKPFQVTCVIYKKHE